jgi:predicted lipoprotein with Yx(FWY)xxD motif
MNRITHLLIPAMASSVLLAACGSASRGSSTSSYHAGTSPSASAASTSAASVVKTAPGSTSGATVLVDGRGLTLYHLTAEQNGKWICTGAACVQVWHPLTVPTGAAPSGTVGSLSTVKRPGGTLQVTYKGMPLYTFAGDRKSGDAKGQGIKDVGTWTAVTTAAAASGKPSTSTSAPARSGY